MLELEGKTYIDWGGAQRWLVSDMSSEIIRQVVENAGGHATLYRNNIDQTDSFHPLPVNMLHIHQQIKRAFDPHGVFNPGRMYKEI